GAAGLGEVLLAESVRDGLLPALRLAAGPVAAVGELALPPLLEVEVAVALGAVGPLAALDAAGVVRAALRGAGPALLRRGLRGLLLRGGLGGHRPLLSGATAAAASAVGTGRG